MRMALCGDVSSDEALELVDAVTQATAAAGTVTTPVWAEHTIEAARHSTEVAG